MISTRMHHLTIVVWLLLPLSANANELVPSENANLPWNLSTLALTAPVPTQVLSTARQSLAGRVDELEKFLATG